MVIESYICDYGHFWKVEWAQAVYPEPTDRQDMCPTCLHSESDKVYLPLTVRRLTVEQYEELIQGELDEHKRKLFELRVPVDQVNQDEPCIVWGDGTATNLFKKAPELRLVN